jgi:hypothetical protein
MELLPHSQIRVQMRIRDLRIVIPTRSSLFRSLLRYSPILGFHCDRFGSLKTFLCEFAQEIGFRWDFEIVP